MNNRDLNIDRNDHDYHFAHNRAALQQKQLKQLVKRDKQIFEHTDSSLDELLAFQ